MWSRACSDVVEARRRSRGPRRRFPSAASIALIATAVVCPTARAQGPTAYLVRDIVAGSGSSSPLSLTAVGRYVFFTPAADGSGSSRNLWRSDGSEGGTVLVQLLSPDPVYSMYPEYLFEAGGILFFRAWDNVDSVDLWKSDPVAGITAPVQNICTSTLQGQFIAPAADYQGQLFFRADDGTHGIEPWIASGAGAILVEDIRPGTAGSAGVLQPRSVAEMGGALYFPAETGAGIELWRTLLGPGTTLLVEDINPGGGSSNPQQLVTIGSTLFFKATTPDAGWELWKVVDTIPSVTVSRVRDIRPGPDSSDPDGLTAVGDTLFFFADDGVSGRELWRSDGTEVGTQRVMDIRSGATGSVQEPGNLPDTAFAGARTRYFFAANDGVHGEELWVSDGTEAGTRLTRDIHPGDPTFPPAELVAVGDSVYFRADTGGSDTEVWISDGTEAGTRQITDIEPGGSYPSNLVNVNGDLYFTAFQSATGRELWKLPLHLFKDGFESGDTGAWSGP